MVPRNRQVLCARLHDVQLVYGDMASKHNGDEKTKSQNNMAWKKTVDVFSPPEHQK